MSFSKSWGLTEAALDLAGVENEGEARAWAGVYLDKLGAPLFGERFEGEGDADGQARGILAAAYVLNLALRLRVEGGGEIADVLAGIGADGAAAVEVEAAGGRALCLVIPESPYCLMACEYAARRGFNAGGLWSDGELPPCDFAAAYVDELRAAAQGGARYSGVIELPTKDGDARRELAADLLNIHLQDLNVSADAGGAVDITPHSALGALWYAVARALGGGRAFACETCGRAWIDTNRRGSLRKYCGEPCKQYAKRNPGGKRKTRIRARG